MYLISIITPTYNSQTFVDYTIASILNQSYANIEIIFVDDGSSDKTIEIIKKYPFTLIQQEKSGACAARNRGFQASKGEYIQFLDADDLLSPNKIADQMAQLNGRDDIISNGRWGRFYTNDPLNEEINWGPHPSLQKDLLPVDWLCQNHMSQTACWLTPRKLIEKAGPWDETLHQNQDGEFFTRVVAQAQEVKYCESAKVYYRSNLGGSISSHVKNEKALTSFYASCESYERVLLSLEKSPTTHLAIADRYQQFVYRAYPQCAALVEKAEAKIKFYGGSHWPPYGGSTLLQYSNKLFGWKFGARLKHWLKR